MSARGNGFCGRCGSALRLRTQASAVVCEGCGKSHTLDEAFGERERELTAGPKEFRFNHGVEARNPDGSKVGEQEEVLRERATVDEKCPKCDHRGLDFYTMQLRSADEGQTVFYECPKCAHTFSQNN